MATKLIKAIHDEGFREAVKAVYIRSVSDADYRQLALNDAAQAFAEIGFDTKEWTPQFVESDGSADDVFVLPPAVDMAEDLTEEELEAVAGGSAATDCNFYTCIVTECITTGRSAESLSSE